MILTAMMQTLTLDMTQPMRTNMELVVQEKLLLRRIMFVLLVLLTSQKLGVSDMASR